MSNHNVTISDTDDDSDVSEINEQPSKNKALPWPETAIELPGKIQSNEGNANFRGKPEQYIKQEALPWQEDLENTNKPKEINILLLGESGVGKSTFINSFANYMKHENFTAVQQNDLSVLIPARFHIFDKKFKKHLIEIGVNDDNEHLSDGAAATQDVKTYVFYVSIENTRYKFRLIDTPGMGDPRGIDQDNKNCDYVLNYLGRLEKIHALCVLLKPTNTRLDVFLNYCVVQVLSRLDKSAVDNIAFLFTNTRGQNYTPGDTYTSLEVLIEKIKNTNKVNLPLSENNVFCFDNEAFRYLASIKQGVEFKDGIREANIESWKYSYNEVYRLLSYIVGLIPHDPKKTISINHARKMVLQLSQPLAEIVQLIGDNIYELDQQTHQLLMENQTLDQLKQKLYMPVIDIKVKELSQPVTVCTAPNCSTVYKVADKNKFHYKQRCHNPCYLNNVPAEIVGDPNILNCWAINRSNQTCHQCNCRFNTHMHIYYETETFQNNIVDENVMKNISTKEDATKEKEKIINQVLNRKEELEKEHKHIIKCSAAFAHFLQQNAITPVNDSLKEYVKYLIAREESLGPNGNEATLTYLKKLLAEYEQEKNVLDEALKSDSASNVITDNSLSGIERKIRELFTLKHFGKKIKQLYDLHQSGGVIEHRQSEFIVKEDYRLSLYDRTKSFVKQGWSQLFGTSQGHNKQERMQYGVVQQTQFSNNMSPFHQSNPREFCPEGAFYFGPNFQNALESSNQNYALSNNTYDEAQRPHYRPTVEELRYWHDYYIREEHLGTGSSSSNYTKGNEKYDLKKGNNGKKGKNRNQKAIESGQRKVNDDFNVPENNSKKGNKKGNKKK